MKSKIFGGILGLMISAALVLNMNLSVKNEKLSDIFLVNVEALADGENGRNYYIVLSVGDGLRLCLANGNNSC